MQSIGRYVVAISSSYATGLVAYFFVNAESFDWYDNLIKPALTPSGGVYLIVWLVLYGLMGIALGAVWSKLPLWDAWVGLYYVSLAFNFSWTIFFFVLHTVWIALIDVATLAVLIIFLTLSAWETDRRASMLLAPYLLWVLFAAYLTMGIWLLN